MDSCAICGETVCEGKETVRLTQKGCEGIQNSGTSQTYADVKPGDIVHTKCRKALTRRKNSATNIHLDGEIDKQKALRSNCETFDFKNRCLFCGCQAKYCPSSRKRSIDVYPDRSLEFQNTIKTICISRGDQWAKEINIRLLHVVDLPAADA
ncbi:hypothetical protein DPMN_170623 [Dreissena polymorpha]|uniref:Uncharacterized protein n=1 Tax=Dreissena polymorpha TaxID=45954 RepID=A0A9D4IEF7_DREPO|nr:hypothetical protein DPMN_170623 [Dreissena polymorpha]